MTIASGEPAGAEPNRAPQKAGVLRAATAILLAAVCLMTLAATFLAATMNDGKHGSRDFVEYWAAGQLVVHAANPYDYAATLNMERSAGWGPPKPQITPSPPVIFFLVAPLGLVSAKTGTLAWMLATVASLVFSVRLIWLIAGRPANKLHLAGFCFAPMITCLMGGQIGVYLLLGLVAFLYYHRARPFCAGAALVICCLKPHLFLPFGIVLLLWVLRERRFRMLAGAVCGLAAACAVAFCFDAHAWAQYAEMLKWAKPEELFTPNLSKLLRLAIDRDAAWLQFVLEAAGCAWAVWYFWTRRARWSWIDDGLLVLIVSVGVAPYAWYTDETVLLPAVLLAGYRMQRAGRSLLPLAVILAVPLAELLSGVWITTAAYAWTIPAWLTWYLYAMRVRSESQVDGRPGAIEQEGAA
jgi:hypothetical protein